MFSLFHLLAILFWLFSVNNCTRIARSWNIQQTSSQSSLKKKQNPNICYVHSVIKAINMIIKMQVKQQGKNSCPLIQTAVIHYLHLSLVISALFLLCLCSVVLWVGICWRLLWYIQKHCEVVSTLFSHNGLILTGDSPPSSYLCWGRKDGQTENWSSRMWEHQQKYIN